MYCLGMSGYRVIPTSIPKNSNLPDPETHFRYPSNGARRRVALGQPFYLRCTPLWPGSRDLGQTASYFRLRCIRRDERLSPSKDLPDTSTSFQFWSTVSMKVWSKGGWGGGDGLGFLSQLGTGYSGTVLDS